MGTSFSSSASRKRQHSKPRVVVQGLRNSGKTTILTRLNLGRLEYPKHSQGIQVETVCFNNVTIKAWRVGDHSTARPAWWRDFYLEAQALIFVVDASDPATLDHARHQLHLTLREPHLSDCAVLVYANKQDIYGAESELRDKLDLLHLHQRWRVQPCVATTGDGLYEGLDWLSSVLADAAPKKITKAPLQYFDDDEERVETAFDCLAAPIAVVFGPRRGINIFTTLKVLSKGAL